MFCIVTIPSIPLMVRQGFIWTQRKRFKRAAKILVISADKLLINRLIENYYQRKLMNYFLII